MTPADEFTNAGAERVLDRRTRTALAHYKLMAESCRTEGAAKRFQADYTNHDGAAALLAAAAAHEADARRWEALAAELEAFEHANQPTPPQTLL